MQEHSNEPRDAAIYSLMAKSKPEDWSVQGFGMMRMYLDPAKEWRLNVWHSSLAVPNVSTIHDHPWNFRSWIIAGRFVNQKFDIYPDSEEIRDRAGNSPESVFQKVDYMRIKTGEGGGPDGVKKTCYLRKFVPQLLLPGDSYDQIWNEVHESMYDDGTVTINRRQRVGTGEHARVFWPHGQEWVDAEPRRATPAEFYSVIHPILQKVPTFAPQRMTGGSRDRSGEPHVVPASATHGPR